MKCVFVTNRPNYCHRRFAEYVECRFYYIKHFLPENIPTISLPLNGVLNSLCLKNSDVFFSESIMDYYPVYYKHSEHKKIVLIAEDTIFKLGLMPDYKKRYILKLFNSVDGFIAISDLCKKILLRYVDKPIKVAYPFPHKEFFRVKVPLDTKNILFVGRNDITKGFIELVKAVKILRKRGLDWNLYLVGDCSNSVSKGDGIHPLGFVKNIESIMKTCTYFVHPAYFDPCPATVFEAMTAGLITIISNNIGQTKIFKDKDLGGLILDNNKPETIANKLEELSKKNNTILSSKLRNISKEFREPKRLEMFKNQFEKLLSEI